MPYVKLTGMSADEITRTFFDPDLKKASRSRVVANENGVGIADENGVEIVNGNRSDIAMENGLEIVDDNGSEIANDNGSEIVNDNGRGVVNENAPENEWTQISELRLFTKAIYFKPAGVNRHFNLGQLTNYMSNIYENEEQTDFELFLTPEDFKLYQKRTELTNKREVLIFKPVYKIRPTPTMIMAKLGEMYDMKTVERNECLPDKFKEEKDFDFYMDSYEKDQTSSVDDRSTPVKKKKKGTKREIVVKREVVSPPPMEIKREVLSPPPPPSIKREVLSPSPSPPRSGSPTLYEIAMTMMKEEKENKENAMETSLEELSMEEKE